MEKWLVKKRHAGEGRAEDQAKKRKEEMKTSLKAGWAPCPCCGQLVGVSAMSHHLDKRCAHYEGSDRRRRPASCAVVYTIGHGTWNEEAIYSRLESVGTTTVIDVRSFPEKAMVPGIDESWKWTRSHLELKSRIAYEWKGSSLGSCGETLIGREEALRSVRDRAVQGEIIALLSVEIDPTKCHRYVLARELMELGIRVAHLRADDSSIAYHPRSPLKPAIPQTIQGNFLVPDFISMEEEKELLRFLDDTNRLEPQWTLRNFNGPAYGQIWGIRTNLKARQLLEPIHPIPSIFGILIRRMRTGLGGPKQNPLAEFYPNEANALDYHRPRGHYLGAHCDDRYLSGPILVNLCLAGDATMTYTRENSRVSRHGSVGDDVDACRVYLPRRALQIQLGKVRYSYTHAIRHEDFHNDRRVSITFRMNRHPGHRI